MASNTQSISDFYQETLGANLKNMRWSWGAVNPMTNRYFLRVWESEIDTIEGRKAVLVLRPTWRSTPNGYREREAHLEAIQAGAEAFGVLCKERWTDREKKNIDSFDENELMRLGDLFEEDGITYAEIEGRVPVTELVDLRTGQSSIDADLRAIGRLRDATSREVLTNARLGQGQFRQDVLELWGGRCAVTGSKTMSAIRASHIKPWRHSTDQERLDPFNGLPLIATIDALFDAHLVSFDSAGKILISSKLPEDEIRLLGISELHLLKSPSEQTEKYLSDHRERVACS